MLERQNADSAPVHERCWCWQYGRCLTDCPTADLPPPRPMTDANWRRAYAEVLAARTQIDGSASDTEAR